MSVVLNLRVVDQAATQIEEIADWWRINRTKAPDAVHEELVRAFDLIMRQPEAGRPQQHSKLPHLRRLLLGRIRMHLYYQVDSASSLVEVLALWQVNRGTGPPL